MDEAGVECPCDDVSPCVISFDETESRSCVSSIVPLTCVWEEDVVLVVEEEVLATLPHTVLCGCCAVEADCVCACDD